MRGARRPLRGEKECPESFRLDRGASVTDALPGSSPSCRAVLWDLDGTLADSSDYHWMAWLQVMTAEGYSLTRDQFLASFGQRNDAILGAWLGPDADPALVARIGDEKEEVYRQLLGAGGIEPLPGAAEWVGRLHGAGWLQAIASSAPRLNVQVMRKALGFEARIEEYVGAEDVRHGKPDPEVFLTAAARVGVPPDRCIVVEDAAAGIEAARRAGMRSVGVGASVLDAADIRVQSLADLPADTFERLLADR